MAELTSTCPCGGVDTLPPWILAVWNYTHPCAVCGRLHTLRPMQTGRVVQHVWPEEPLQDAQEPPQEATAL